MTANRPQLRILVARPDRLGDVILSTPVLDVLKSHYPGSHLTFLVRDPVVSVVKGLRSVDQIMVYDPEGRHKGVGGFFRLMEEVRKNNFQIGVVLQSQLRIAAALFGAGVPHRVGSLAKPHSFLFYNRGSQQHRSQVEMHEADYNLQLLRTLGIRTGTRKVPTAVHFSSEPGGAREFAQKWLAEKGWKADAGTKLVVVHPGMGGSALNWPEAHYIELIRLLCKEGHQVLVTGGPGEGLLLSRIQDELAHSSARAIFYGGAGAGAVDQLAALMSFASVVVAPSTGPLHLAVALGIPVVTFYPPVRVQSAIRWGPYVSEQSKASILVPEVYCGQDFHCIGSLCNYHPCMKSMTVGQTLEQVHLQLGQLEKHVT